MISVLSVYMAVTTLFRKRCVSMVWAFTHPDRKGGVGVDIAREFFCILLGVKRPARLVAVGVYRNEA